MKVILPVQSTVALHVSPDEVVPEKGLFLRDLIDLVASAYSFAIKPPVPASLAMYGGQNLFFQSGVMVSGNERWPIAQLANVPNGEMVTASTTAIAEKVLEDYMARLDASLGYRFAESQSKRRSYQSNLIVEFGHDLEDKIEIFKKIEAFVAREIPSTPAPFKFKRLSFGVGELIQALTLENIEKSDFVIERRYSGPSSSNRYFCSAPVSTDEHIRIMRAFEREIAG
jgi:hypothetical protein